jgi:hypothetical protein
MTEIYTLIYLVVSASVSAFVWINVLTAPNGLLSGLPTLLRFLPERIFWPLFDCAKCNSPYWFVFYFFAVDSTLEEVALCFSLIMYTIFITYFIEKYASSFN